MGNVLGSTDSCQGWIIHRVVILGHVVGMLLEIVIANDGS